MRGSLKHERVGIPVSLLLLVMPSCSPPAHVPAAAPAGRKSTGPVNRLLISSTVFVVWGAGTAPSSRVCCNISQLQVSDTHAARMVSVFVLWCSNDSWVLYVPTYLPTYLQLLIGGIEVWSMLLFAAHP
jgi:hypothetical protein